jgi:hypothetical protein
LSATKKTRPRISAPAERTPPPEVKAEKVPKPKGGARNTKRKPRNLSPDRRIAYSVGEVSEMTGWSRQTIWRRVRAGKINLSKIGLISKHELRRLGLLPGEAAE